MPMIAEHRAEILQRRDREYLFGLDDGRDGSVFARLLGHVLGRDRVRVHLSDGRCESGVVRSVHLDTGSGALHVRVELTGGLYPTVV